MNHSYAYAFESLDERALQMKSRLLDLLNGETSLEGLGDEDPVDLDDFVNNFDLH